MHSPSYDDDDDDNNDNGISFVDETGDIPHDSPELLEQIKQECIYDLTLECVSYLFLLLTLVISSCFFSW